MQKLFAPLLLLVFAFPSFGHSNYAGMTGSFTDAQHLPIQGANIEIQAASTGATRHLVTNEHGLFEAAALLPDDYELKAERPGDESAIPQNDSDLAAEKGPGCDVRNRFALSSVYDIPAWRRAEWTRIVTQNWQFSMVYQVQSGMPFTISVFGDTANSGTVLGENPIRANRTTRPVFGPGTHSAAEWFNPGAFVAPPAYTFGDVGRNSVYGPPLQTMDIALVRAVRVTEKLNLQIRAEAFNALNHTNLGTPNRYVNEPQFGTITMAMTPGREIQLSARLSF